MCACARLTHLRIELWIRVFVWICIFACTRCAMRFRHTCMRLVRSSKRTQTQSYLACNFWLIYCDRLVTELQHQLQNQTIERTVLRYLSAQGSVCVEFGHRFDICCFGNQFVNFKFHSHDSWWPWFHMQLNANNIAPSEMQRKMMIFFWQIEVGTCNVSVSYHFSFQCNRLALAHVASDAGVSVTRWEYREIMSI